MTLEEKIDLVRFIVDQKMPGKKLEIEELNSILKAVEYDLMADVYGKVGGVNGFETEGQLGDAILPFKTTSSISLTAGLGVLPTNYLHWGKCTYTSSGDIIPVELVSTREAEQRRFNTITAPTTRFPIVEITGTSSFQVYPTSITAVSLTYIKRPTPASYVLTLSNGVYQYDSVNSVQTSWGAELHVPYIRHILKYLGISVNDMNIVNYVETKNAQVH